MLTGLKRRFLALVRPSPAAGFSRRYEGAHENDIRRLFHGRTVLAPGSYAGRTLVVLAFTNRCGSNLTASLMAKCRLTTPAREMLNAQSARKSGAEAGRASVQAYMDWLTTIDKIDAPFAIKASFDQLAMLLRWGAREAFGDLRVVHVVREDILGQAVSFSIAGQTQRWMSSQKGLDVQPVFDPADILQRLDAICAANARIAEICRFTDLPILPVSYEAMLTDPLAQLTRIATFLGHGAAPLKAPTPDIEQQRDAINEAFVQQFCDWAQTGGKLKIGGLTKGSQAPLNSGAPAPHRAPR